MQRKVVRVYYGPPLCDKPWYNLRGCLGRYLSFSNFFCCFRLFGTDDANAGHER